MLVWYLLIDYIVRTQMRVSISQCTYIYWHPHVTITDTCCDLSTMSIRPIVTLVVTI